MRIRTFRAVLPLLWLAAGTWAEPARENIVWQIGKFDHTPAEFSGRDTDQVVVDAAAPDAARRWPAAQSGTLNAQSSLQSHSRLVRFRLTEPPRGDYSLDFAVLAGNPRVPHLELDLNGKPGAAWFDRHLSYHAEGRADSPINAEARVSVPVPASALRLGQNELRITAVDDDPDENGDSQFLWDALALRRSSSPATATATVLLDPTYFFANRRGGMHELVRALVRLPETPSNGRFTLSLAGTQYHANLVAGHFGWQRFEFWVPELSGPHVSASTIEVNGKSYNSTTMLAPRRKLTVYIVPHTHLDIGFTDYQPKIEELQNRNLDRLLEEMRRDPDMRFSLDGAWLAEQFLRTRSASSQGEFLDLVRAGRISIPAQYANLMAGGAGLETLVRSLYAGRALNLRAGRSADYANITDVPAYPWAYAGVLSAAGVKYFAAGANDDRGPQPLIGRWQTRSPFWWQAPDGSKVLMAYTRQYSNLWFVCGLPPSEAGCRQSLPVFFQTFDSPDYRPDTLLMFGSQLENTDLIPGEGEFVRHWNEKYAYPHLQLATFRDYFQHIEDANGPQLATVRGDFGPYWEDGIGTDAQYAALYRHAEARAPAVETLASLATLAHPEWAPPLDRLHRLWDDLILYAEHTYTSWGGYSRPQSDESLGQIRTKHFEVDDARETAHWIAQESMSRLMDSIRVQPPAVVVFNSLAHERSALVETDLDNGMALVDSATEKAVPLEWIRAAEGYHRVRFMAEHVPALGYRVYRLERQQSANVAASAKPGSTIENAFYRVTVDPTRGAISSVFDKQLNRELVDPRSPYLLNQYLYVSGGDNSRLIHITEHLPAAKLTVAASTAATWFSAARTPWGSTLTYRASAPHAGAIGVEIRLFDAEKKIEIVNRFDKQPVSDKEAVYFAFPFAAANPQFEYEGQTGTVNPARDELAGGNREWYGAGHWARVSGGGVSAAVLPLDAPLVTFGDINRGLWPEKFEPKSATIFSYALNNYWHTNFPRVQSGEFKFAYVLTSGADLNPAALSRLGRDSLTPLELGELDKNDKIGTRGSLPAGEASLLSVGGDSVELETLKPAEDGDGYIARLLETGGHAGIARLSSRVLAIEHAWLCRAGEDNQRELTPESGAIAIPLQPWSIATVRIRLHPL